MRTQNFCSRPPLPYRSYALLKKTFAALYLFTTHIHPSLRYKGGTYENIYTGTTPNLQIHQRISSLYTLKIHKKHISYFILATSLQFAISHLILQKYTTPISTYHTTSFILHNYHDTHSHPIFSQQLFLITLTLQHIAFIKNRSGMFFQKCDSSLFFQTLPPIILRNNSSQLSFLYFWYILPSIYLVNTYILTTSKSHILSIPETFPLLMFLTQCSSYLFLRTTLFIYILLPLQSQRHSTVTIPLPVL